MDKNLETLLKYQEIDIKLRRKLDSLERSDAKKKMDVARTEFNNAKKSVGDSEAAAGKTIKDIEEVSLKIKEYSQKLGELVLIVENAESDDDLTGFVEELEALKSKVVALEKKLADLKATGEGLVKDYRNANTIGHKMLDQYNSAKAEYNTLLKESEPEINLLKKQLKDLESQIDADTMRKYKSITAENKYPAFVEVHIGDGGICSCRGCGLQLSQKNTSILNENGICTCETCRRVIFKR